MVSKYLSIINVYSWFFGYYGNRFDMHIYGDSSMPF